MTTPSRVAALLSVLVLVSTGLPAQAAESYDNCAGTISVLPATITAQGVWCLKADLATNLASGSAILVNAHNVTIDCNGFKLGGLGAGPGTQTVGIRVPTRQNTVVRGCNIRGFAVGILANDGSGHVIEDNRIEASTRRGIEVHGVGSTVRRNIVTDTGASTDPAVPYGVGIWVQYGANVIDNTVAGVAPGVAGGNAVGIYAKLNDGGTIAGNRISGLAPAGAGTANGIVDENGGSAVSRNVMTGPTIASGIGIGCLSGATTVTGNVIRGFQNAASAVCTSSGNIFNPN